MTVLPARPFWGVGQLLYLPNWRQGRSTTWWVPYLPCQGAEESGGGFPTHLSGEEAGQLPYLPGQGEEAGWTAYLPWHGSGGQVLYILGREGAPIPS